MSEGRKYAFSWDAVIGNIGMARPNLGSSTRVEVYRLLQFTLRDMLEQRFGTETADELFREAGVLAGTEFYKQFCSEVTNVGELVKTLQERFKEYGIGIVRMEKSDLDRLTFTLTVDEDLDCSGMPDTNDVICIYDEGFIQGVLQQFSGRGFIVREVDCWCTGGRTCRFDAVPRE